MVPLQASVALITSELVQKEHLNTVPTCSLQYTVTQKVNMHKGTSKHSTFTSLSCLKSERVQRPMDATHNRIVITSIKT